MKHSLVNYLEDVRISINDIENYSRAVSSSLDIENNQLLFDALCRRFAIIGEALYKAEKLNGPLAITDKTKLSGSGISLYTTMIWLEHQICGR